jgi:hypothetical protein
MFGSLCRCGFDGPHHMNLIEQSSVEQHESALDTE